MPSRLAPVRIGVLLGLMSVAAATPAVERQDLADVPAIHGRYAPAGDCSKTPRIEVDAKGMRFDIAGTKVATGRMEQMLTYLGPDYRGNSLWFFPFIEAPPDQHPILMTFNDEEKPGRLTIQPYDKGWQGGPPLSPRDKALVEGSPYAPCR